MTLKKKNSLSVSVDVKDISIGDFLTSLKRLKISSVIWILGAVIASFGFVIGFIKKTDYDLLNSRISTYQDSLKKERLAQDSVLKFQNFYVVRFSDKNTLQKIVPSILEEHFDGISTYEEAMRCLLFQVKSQNGFAEFLRGGESVTLKLRPDSTAINFEWDKRSNILLKIVKNLPLNLNDAQLRQSNSELNFFGMTWLDDGSTVTRDFSGGLEVINK